ncbi:MAG: maleylpyruvate isomerase N-terminal domain-containing protein [Microbacteriaceae bacterium]|nr:maleylpyruvate isomerase N-terminal domain-containing protein [Microbacteriaceae bacterium]MCL2794730.1 maleylpyruvate isomerase N-terminal domain-containing protein [Microbacteriaceae bacterium]
MGLSWDEVRTGFGAAAAWFVHTAGQVDGRWAEPGLGEWDIRSLVGHTSRALITVEEYLARPASSIALASPAEYYRATRLLSRGDEVPARGRAAGLALGDDPATAVGALAERVVPLVSACSGAETVTTIAGGMSLAAYLPTRVFELVVHTADLAAALGVPSEVPESSARVALSVAAELAIGAHATAEVLFAVTGRAVLPAGFTLI